MLFDLIGVKMLFHKKNDNNQPINAIDTIVCALKAVATIGAISCFIVLILLLFACDF